MFCLIFKSFHICQEVQLDKFSQAEHSLIVHPVLHLLTFGHICFIISPKIFSFLNHLLIMNIIPHQPLNTSECKNKHTLLCNPRT